MIMFMAAPRRHVDPELAAVAGTDEALFVGTKSDKTDYPLWVSREAAVQFLRDNLGFWPGEHSPMGIYRVKFKGGARALKGPHEVFGDDGAFKPARKGKVMSRLDVK